MERPVRARRAAPALLLSLRLSLLGAAFAGAFEGGDRVFSLGLGAGNTSSAFEPETGPSREDDDPSLAVGLRYGRALTRTWLLDYSVQTHVFPYGREGGGTSTFGAHIGALEVVKFLRSGEGGFTPSPYVYAGAGYSIWGRLSLVSLKSLLGYGFLGGAGYRFSPSWAVEGGAFHGSASLGLDGATGSARMTGLNLQVVYWGIVPF